MSDTNQNLNPFPVWVTAVLLIFLTIPFGLRILSPDLEAFPVIILPSGASTLSLDEQTLEYDAQILWGKNRSGEWEQLDPVTFLEPIPSHFLFEILENDFGLTGAPKTIEFRSDVMPPYDLEPKRFTESDIESTRNWISIKLSAAGLSPDELKVTTEKRRVNILSGRVSSTTITDEQFFSLHP